MRIGIATVFSRGLPGLVRTAFVVGLLGVGCSAQDSERRGGGDLPDLTAGSGAAAGGDASQGGASGGSNSSAVPWCDAYRVINCSCQQCHQNPTRRGAAMPLMTYEDTQLPYPLPSSPKRVWEQMEDAVASGLMPFTGDKSVTPPVRPLSEEQRATLLTWLAQGAKDVGGTDCPQTCDWSQ